MNASNDMGRFMGLNIDLSISVQPQQAPQNDSPLLPPSHSSQSSQQQAGNPLQLDLLPRPPASNGFSWQSLFPRSSSDLPNSATSCRAAIDVNQVPSCHEPVAEEDDSSSLQLNMNAGAARNSHSNNSNKSYPTKRERDVEDKCEITSSRASDEDEGATRKKLRLSKEQSALLEESFREHSTLNPKQKNALAKQLNLRPRQVEVWFQNRRARTKLKQTEVDCELLKRCYERLTEENHRLQKELQELRALKVAPPCVITHDFYMPLPATTLTMCPSCERLATVVDTNNNSTSHNTTTTNNNINTGSSHSQSIMSGAFLSTKSGSAKLVKYHPQQQHQQQQQQQQHQLQQQQQQLIRAEFMN